MIDILTETGFWVRLIFTVGLFGGGAYMSGQAVARGWHGVGPVLFYVALMALGHRFLVWALFGGTLLTLTGLVFDLVLILPFGLLGYYATRARRMVAQYPWLYERAGPFGWRDRGPAPGPGTG